MMPAVTTVTPGDSPLSPACPPVDLRKLRPVTAVTGFGGAEGSARTSWSAPDLLAAEFTDPKWAVEGLLPEGATLLAGPPKIGKSWLSLNLAVAVASGGMALGKIKVDAGPALYLALEDTPRRLKSRLSKVVGNSEAPAMLDIATECPVMHSGGLARIDGWLDRHPDARLVVIDVMARFRGPKPVGVADYDYDYNCIAMVKQIADAHSVAIVAVEHTRKMADGDFLQEVSGTNGKAGAADTVMVLRRPRGDADGELNITGRDVDENCMALAFSAQAGSWQLMEGPAIQHTVASTRKQIIQFLTEYGAGSPASISEAVGISRDNAKHTLIRMNSDRQIDTDGNGNYFMPFSTDTLTP